MGLLRAQVRGKGNEHHGRKKEKRRDEKRAERAAHGRQTVSNTQKTHKKTQNNPF